MTGIYAGTKTDSEILVKTIIGYISKLTGDRTHAAKGYWQQGVEIIRSRKHMAQCNDMFNA